MTHLDSAYAKKTAPPGFALVRAGIAKIVASSDPSGHIGEFGSSAYAQIGPVLSVFGSENRVANQTRVRGRRLDAKHRHVSNDFQILAFRTAG